MEKIKALIIKYKEIISYLVFGVLTTLVNYIVYLIFAPVFNTAAIPTAIAWAASVAFAYVTNKIFVFRSQAKGAEAVKEAGRFVGARVLSGAIDVLFMFLTVDILKLNGKIMKLAANVFVVIFNYAASKLVVFSGKNDSTSSKN